MTKSDVAVDPRIWKKYQNGSVLTDWEASYIDDAMANIKRITPVPEAVSLSEDDKLRGEYPMADGLLDYFPNALAEVARISKFGNDKHNPGQQMHWSRWNSTDHANKILRHLIDRGKTDSNGMTHSGYVAWRALAMLQEELEQKGAPVSRGSKVQP